jgi:hypothetical protein
MTTTIDLFNRNIKELNKFQDIIANSNTPSDKLVDAFEALMKELKNEQFYDIFNNISAITKYIYS